MFAYALHPARASLLLALVSAAILLAALALQFLGGLAPCPLGGASSAAGMWPWSRSA